MPDTRSPSGLRGQLDASRTRRCALSLSGVPRLRRSLSLAGLLVAAGAVTAAISLAAFAAGLWWPLELLAHFRAQYCGALLALSAAALLLRRRAAAAAFALVALLNAAPVVALWSAPDAVEGSRNAGGNARHRAVLFNVYVFNEQRERVLEWLRQTDPDIAVLLETDARWLETLAPLRASHPHVIAQPRSDPFGIALFSKHPLRAPRVELIGEAAVPSIVTGIELVGTTLTLVATHPVPPWGGLLVALRDQQLARVGDAVAALARPLLLLGDLNTSQASPLFGRLLAASGLRDSTRGFGYQPTWPTGLPLLAIPLDHCLHSEDIAIEDRRVGPHLGSDHWPLIIDFRLPSARR
jgi:endonuclease/exonuclease/phosphatase (EEP) superfamily protein YafD